MNQETQNIKPIVKTITIKHIVDESPDLSYLGEFSNTEGKYSVPHSNERNTLRYFNAANVDNMDQATGNYIRMMQFENGRYNLIGIKAIAEIYIPIGDNSFSIQHITSSGLWGIESDGSKDYIKEIETDQVNEVKDYLKVLGCIEIDKAIIQYKD